MNLKELKQMIGEEYRYWIAEQPGAGAPGAPPPNIPPAGAPGVEVGPDDMMGGGDSEATLRQIYDMLKAYFEGGAEAPAGGDMGMDDISSAEMDADMDMDMDMGDDAGDAGDAGDDDSDEEEVEEEKEDKDDKKESKKDKKESKKDKDALQERFQKLANIIKG